MPLGGAICVRILDDSQFPHVTLRYAFCSILHRYKSLDIHLWEFLYLVVLDGRLGFRLGKFTFELVFSGNDPSAGSPTETLLRLHLPLNDKV
jgi:hypothetical protein